MMKEQVIVTQLRITKAGQSKHFQVRLPKNTKRIIGIEVGGRLVNIIRKGQDTGVSGNGAAVENTATADGLNTLKQ